MCNLSCGVKTVSLLSCLLAAAVVIDGGFLLQKSYEEREKYGGLGKELGKASVDFTRSIGLTPTDVTGDSYWKTLLSVSAVAVAAGALQLLTSLFLLLCASSKGGRISAKIWVGVNFFTILALGSALACLLWQERFRKEAESDNLLLSFMGALAVDAIFLFLFMFINAAFSCRSSN